MPKSKYVIYATLTAIILIGSYVSLNYFFESVGEEVKSNYRIGLLLIDKDVQGENLAGFKSKFAELGFSEGQNVEYITRNAGSDRGAILKGYAEELNGMGLDLIIVGSRS